MLFFWAVIILLFLLGAGALLFWGVLKTFELRRASSKTAVFSVIFLLPLALALWSVKIFSEDVSLKESRQPEAIFKETQTPNIPAPANETPETPSIPANENPRLKSVLLNVPFTSQAPFREWADPVQQDACEEASVIMTIRWAKGLGTISKEEALSQIRAIAAFEKTQTGEFRDTSAQDTVDLIFKGFFNYQNTQIKPVNSFEDLVFELMRNNAVIVPVNGQKLNNPFFTQPGPERHMLVVKGYDAQTKEFITNDPGIGRGESYRYPQDILFSALRDYISGYHEPVPETKKVMIVVSPL